MEPQLQIFLGKLDKAASQKVQIVAIGGNAVVTLGLRDITYDVDICVKKKDYPIVHAVCEELLKEDKVASHVLIDGDFVTFNIPDFWERAIPYDTKFSKIDLRLLNINDILLCKIDRSLDQDKKDVEDIMNKFDIAVGDLKSRYELYLSTYKGHPTRKKEFEINYKTFLTEHKL